MSSIYSLLIISIALFLSSFHAESKTYSLYELQELVKSSPALIQQQTMIDGTLGQQSLDQSQYDPQAYAKAAYESTKETPLIPFQPPSDPYKEFEIGIRKKTHYGLEWALSANSTSLVSKPTIESAKFGPKLTLNIDLLSNIFGRLDRAERELFNSQKEFLELQKKILHSQIKSGVSELFWSIQSLMTQKELLQKQIGLSQSLVKDLKRKRRDGFVESGDVLSAQSQLNSLETQVHLLNYQISNLKKELIKILPKVSPINFQLERKSLSTQAKIAYQCMKGQVKAQPPYHQSYYQPLIEIAEKKLTSKAVLADQVGAPQLKAYATLSSSHTETTTDEALDNYFDKEEQGFQVGVNFVLPLGSEGSESRSRQLAAAKSEALSIRLEYESLMNSLYSDIRQSLGILSTALVKQNTSSQSLEKSYQFKRKKYRQARADLTELLTEQNRVIQSELNEVNISFTILQKLIEYQKTFHLTPCKG